ncbi:MAG: cupin domain-containing protein [Bacteroidales bacterium]|nr:cupin domain-containing protein [Bacteroidales bacterium]MDD3522162.1 cupin domain-containing protein [Bacteroidales bacterium]MDD4029978.1 cupin domain-containing protein [Bacteroidales bacterium]MDD4434753.1 cupin domain-containing protein [Bacteroidales bacterium]MDD5732710.1 cupin domain-containing protein [Bacteroidales bacterium]
MKTFFYLLSITLLLLFVSCNCPSGQVTPASAEEESPVVFQDYGPQPFVLDIEAYTLKNDLFRRAIWTGTHMQMTVMSLAPGEEIGIENHPHTDQFLRVESGKGIVVMGNVRDSLDFREEVEDDFAVLIPAGKWHNLTNTGEEPMKIYSIYTPINHPFGTIHQTYEEAMEAESHHAD